jgi:nucleotide-binding universal stress UspA family protein
MNESGAHDLQMIEQALLADDPQFIAQFRQATEQLDTAAPDAPPGPILVAVDGTLESMQAVHWAATLARTSGADMRIVHAFRWRSYPMDHGVSELADLSLQQASEDICRSAVDLASAVAPGSRVSGQIVGGLPGPAIVHAAKGIALLVLGSHRLGLLRGLLRTSTLPYVVNHVRCAVAVLPAIDSIPPQLLAAPPRVSVGVDGSAGDGPALARALRIASAGASELLVVCAAGAEQATTEALAALRRDVPVPAVEQMTAADHVVDALIRLAPSSQALVCDRSQLALNKPWRGRAGRRLIRDATCPVLLTCTASSDPRSR